MSNRIFSEIMDAPDAYLVLDAVHKALDEERERRLKFYNDITEEQKVEFINGEIVTHSPAKFRHSNIGGMLYTLLTLYVRKNKLGFVGFENVMISLTRNDYEPDISFFRKEKAIEFSQDKMFYPAPDLIVEILSPSTAKRDRGIKFKDYGAHGVEEYWIIDPVKKTMEQYHLMDNKYELVLNADSGDVKSFAVKGFQIPIRAIFDDDENLKAIQNL
ncbi:Endonuclease, Uma2 family (restriction endonuclease fold) [Dyadobacter sp. SG02]|nr:Endonuclease, Uma2 family (restriction endonuclease fold) [Dyadobacter sp. SG02]